MDEDGQIKVDVQCEFKFDEPEVALKVEGRGKRLQMTLEFPSTLNYKTKRQMAMAIQNDPLKYYRNGGGADSDDDSEEGEAPSALVISQARARGSAEAPSALVISQPRARGSAETPRALVIPQPRARGSASATASAGEAPSALVISRPRPRARGSASATASASANPKRQEQYPTRSGSAKKVRR